MEAEITSTNGDEKIDHAAAVAALEGVVLDKAAPETLEAAKHIRAGDLREGVGGKAEFLVGISDVAPEAIDLVLEMANGAKDSYDRKRIVAPLVPIYVESGQLPQLLEMFETDYDRDSIIRSATTLMIESGQIDQALSWSQQLNSEYDRRIVVTQLAKDTTEHDQQLFELAKTIREPDHEAKALIPLARRLPEAKARLQTIFDTEMLRPTVAIEIGVEVADVMPQLVPTITEYFTQMNPPDRYGTTTERKNYSERQGRVEDAIIKAAQAGHLDEAAAAADHIPGLSRRLCEKANAVEGIDPEFKLQLAERMSDTYYLKGAIKVLGPELAQQGKQAKITETVNKMRGTKDEEAIVIMAARFMPELLGEAEGYVDKKHTFDQHDEWLNLIPAYAATGRLDEVIDKFRQDHFYTSNLPKLCSGIAGLGPDYVEKALAMAEELEGARKIDFQAGLAKQRPELAEQILQSYDDVMMPAITKFKAKEDKYASNSTGYDYDRTTLRAIDGLVAAGKVDQAIGLVDNTIFLSSKADALTKLVVHDSSLAPEAAATLVRQRDKEGFQEKFMFLVGQVPDSELFNLAEATQREDGSVPAEIIRLVADRLITSGRVSQLVELIRPPQVEDNAKLPEHEYYQRQRTDISYAVLLHDIEPKLREMDCREEVLAILGRLRDSPTKQARMTELVGNYPEIAPDLLALAQKNREVGDYYGKKGYFPSLAVLIEQIPEVIPEAVGIARSIIDDRVQGKQRGDEGDLATCVRVIRALAHVGRAADALGLMNTYVVGGPDLFVEIAQDLVATGHGGEAMSYVRRKGNASAKAMMLASIARAAMAVGDPDQRAKDQVSLMGREAIDAAAHALSDRSINYRYFVDDIAARPALIETFLSRATSPAEIRQILDVVTLASEGRDDGVDLQLRALEMLKGFGSASVMKERWKQDRQEQALGGMKADSDRFRPLANLEQLSNNYDVETGRRAFEAGYTARDLFDHPWLLKSDIDKAFTENGDIFPTTGSKNSQWEWLADHSFVRLEGFSRRTIGQILANRLAANTEYSLHDASQWMRSFSMDEEYSSYNSETGAVESIRIIDFAAEQRFLTTLMTGEFDQEQLRRLPGFASAGGEATEIKTQKFDSMFVDPSHTLIYAAILHTLATSPGGRITPSQVEENLQTWSDEGITQHWVGQSKEVVKNLNNEFRDRIGDRWRRIAEAVDADFYGPHEPLPNQVNRLKDLGKARKEYVDTTTAWIRNYQNLSGQRLQRVWSNRVDALEEGVEDTPAEIERWAASSGFRIYIKNQIGEETRSGIKTRELLSKYRDFIPELSPRYSNPQILQALEMLWDLHDPQSDFVPATIELASGNVFKVFAREDPAGFTIGPDTDCCMTIGGASESCIRAGYSKPEAGFVGLFDPDGKIIAQSFVWHNQGTLVLDNIEAQRGRNLSKIQDDYREALTGYLGQWHQARPDLGVTGVNMGTGYLEARLSAGLRETNAVPLPANLTGIYTDARSQLGLLRLTPEEIEAMTQPAEPEPAAANVQPIPVPEAKVEFKVQADIDQMTDTITRLEAEIYPPEMQAGRSNMRDDLRRPKNYSFLISSRRGNAEVVGYMVAYKDEIREAVYVADLAILPTEQRGGYGMAAMDSLMEQAAANDEKRIIFEARENTSYRVLQTEAAQALLAKHGYHIESSERLENFYHNGESTYLVELLINT